MTTSILPVTALLPELQHALTEQIVVLEAPPGAGKSTVIPLTLLISERYASAKPHKLIILVQPRRVAAVSIAHFLAEQLNEPVGERVGYWVRGERKNSAKTGLLVVTDGMLTRIIQQDPELKNIALIIFDEFHERNLQCDLGLALALEARELNESLQLLVMSATLPAEALAKWLRSRDLAVAVLSSEGRQYPIQLHYRPPRQNVDWQQALPAVVMEALKSAQQGVLVFLPGQREIRRLRAALELPPSVQCFELYGGLTLKEQQRALKPLLGSDIKLVLATNVAETSLTIPDIDVVVDSGRERQAKYLPKYQFTQLQTRYIASASATQRAGRAGRTGPGQCFRLWPESMNQGFAAYSKPALETEDLRSVVLEAAAWGSSPSALAWFTQPPAGALAAANEWLTEANLLNASANNLLSKQEVAYLSPLGHEVQALGTDVEIAMLLTFAQDTNTLALFSEYLQAVSTEQQTRASAEETQNIQNKIRMAAALIAAHQEAHEHRAAGELANVIGYWLARPAEFKQSHRRLQHWCQRLDITWPDQVPDTDILGLLLLMAMPMRLAKAASNSSRYQMATGVAMQLAVTDDHSVEKGQWLLVTQVSLQEERAEGVIWQALALPKRVLDFWIDKRVEPREGWQWVGAQGRLQLVEQHRLGALIFSERASTQGVSEQQHLSAMLSVLRERGELLFSETTANKGEQWLMRVQLAAELLGLSVHSWQPEQLLASMPDWAAHDIQQLKTRQQALQWSPLPALKQYFAMQTEYRGEAQLAELLPVKWQAPSGRAHSIEYRSDGTASVALKLQEVFGTPASPKVAQGRITLSFDLLSPAGRPLHKTSDLASFWKNGYVHVRKEMRGRYPKHPWPEDPVSAQATHLTKRALGRQAD